MTRRLKQAGFVAMTLLFAALLCAFFATGIRAYADDALTTAQITATDEGESSEATPIVDTDAQEDTPGETTDEEANDGDSFRSGDMAPTIAVSTIAVLSVASIVNATLFK